MTEEEVVNLAYRFLGKHFGNKLTKKYDFNDKLEIEEYVVLECSPKELLEGVIFLYDFYFQGLSNYERILFRQVLSNVKQVILLDEETYFVFKSLKSESVDER